MSKERSSGHKGPWTRHTPGPWRVAGESHANVILCERFVVADVYRYQPYNIGPNSDKEAKANARLIARAPDLYELAKSEYDAHNGFETLPMGYPAERAKAIKDIIAYVTAT